MATEVPVPGVTTRVMTHIAKYMDYHKGTEPPIIEKPLRSKVMKDVCKEAWDAEFIDAIGEDRQLLYDLILVRVGSGLSVCSVAVAGCQLHGHSRAVAPRVRQGRQPYQGYVCCRFSV